MTHRLVIVRHGNTFAPGETPRRIGARTDLPLVTSGQTQARRLGEWFAAQGYRFDKILCSPLRRTRETAELILSAQASPPPITAAGFLAEIDHGVDENRPDEQIIARIGQKALSAWDCDGIIPQGWSADPDARQTGWMKILSEVTSSTTLLVTSNGAARFALMAHPKLAREAAGLPSFKLRTASFGMIEVKAEGPALVAWDHRP